MNISALLSLVRRYDQNANVIFDREEPIGQPTDLVMPRRRWFRANSSFRATRPGTVALRDARDAHTHS